MKKGDTSMGRTKQMTAVALSTVMAAAAFSGTPITAKADILDSYAPTDR